ncbi:hypothetical protein Btru_030861 [Bulinus truncatus]|nr:hypothetical protein Btru_030861 [Bulinus truncatus]
MEDILSKYEIRLRVLSKYKYVYLLYSGTHVIASASQHCTSKLMMCTKMMIRIVSRLEDKSSVCQVLNRYFNCIETNCVEYLSPCDTSKYRNNMLSSLTYCSDYVTPIALDCIKETSSATSLWNDLSLLATLSLCIVYIKSYVF